MICSDRSVSPAFHDALRWAGLGLSGAAERSGGHKLLEQTEMGSMCQTWMPQALGHTRWDGCLQGQGGTPSCWLSGSKPRAIGLGPCYLWSSPKVPVASILAHARFLSSHSPFFHHPLGNGPKQTTRPGVGCGSGSAMESTAHSCL